MKHTQGKLHLNTQYADIEIRGPEESGVLVAVMSPWGIAADCPNMQPGNARRLVACWNACDLLDTDAVEELQRGGGVAELLTLSQGVLEQKRALKAQRDELLAIVEAVTLATDEGDDAAMGTHYVAKDARIRCKGSFLALIEQARAAVVKHKEAKHG